MQADWSLLSELRGWQHKGVLGWWDVGSIDDSLIEMESVLPNDLFFRANRQNLINVDYVHSIAQGPGRDFIVNLKEPYSSIEFILTPEKKKELIEMLMYGSSSCQPEWEESDTRFVKRFWYYSRFHRFHYQYFCRKTCRGDKVVYIMRGSCRMRNVLVMRGSSIFFKYARGGHSGLGVKFVDSRVSYFCVLFWSKRTLLK